MYCIAESKDAGGVRNPRALRSLYIKLCLVHCTRVHLFSVASVVACKSMVWVLFFIVVFGVQQLLRELLEYPCKVQHEYLKQVGVAQTVNTVQWSVHSSIV